MKIVTPRHFGILTSGGQAPGAGWTGHWQLAGLTYTCGCGRAHAVGEHAAPIRDLRRMPVQTVLASTCGWLTLVKVRGMFLAKGLRPIASTKVHSEEEKRELEEGTLSAHGISSESAGTPLTSPAPTSQSAPPSDDRLLLETAEWVGRGFHLNRKAHPDWDDARIAGFMVVARYSTGSKRLEELELRNTVWSEFRTAPSLDALLHAILVNEGVVQRDDKHALGRASHHLSLIAGELGLDAAVHAIKM